MRSTHDRGLMAGNRTSNAVLALKRVWYAGRGEPITLGEHELRYLVGSRPVRLKYATSDDIVARNDAKQLQFFLDRVRPGQFVLDVGAHYGEYAVLFAALVGAGGRVISFEPDAAARPWLQRNLALNGFVDRVLVEECAVFDVATPRTLYARHGNSQSSLARAGLGGAESDADVERYSVEAVRIDEYITYNGLPVPDVIKLDVEGAEIHALRGAGYILRSTPTILCELHPYAWKEFGSTFDDLLQIVLNAGRAIRYLDESIRIENGPIYGAVVIS